MKSERPTVRFSLVVRREGVSRTQQELASDMRASAGIERRRLSVQVLGWALLLTQTVTAGSGGTVSLPQPGRKVLRPSGLRLDITSNWVEASGYRPVQVEITSALPAPADRRLTIVMASTDYYPRRESAVQVQVVLPQGSSRVSRSVPVPQDAIWQQWSIDVFEDGQRVEDLSGNVAWPRTSQRWGWTESHPSFLFIHRDAPSANLSTAATSAASRRRNRSEAPLSHLRAWVQLLPDPDQALLLELTAGGSDDGSIVDSGLTDRDILTMLQRLPSVAFLPPADLPDRWIDYTCLDLIFVSLSDLAELADQQADTWEALRTYIATGGNLLVYGVGPNFERLKELQQIVGFDPPSERQPERTGGWRIPRPAMFGRSPYTAGSEEYVTVVGPGGWNRQRTVRDSRVTKQSQQTTSIPDPMFRLRDLQFGAVVAISNDSPLSQDEPQRNWLLSELSEERWRWCKRHGLSQHRPNTDFWDFLIPGVGAAPVKAFLFIITAFVLAIGPLNYYLLRRWNRLYWLLVTVPVGAAIVTGCLFAYALVSDGLRTRTRMRSYTEIDAGRNTAVSWSRQTYYAGLAPSGGMVFPKEAAVYPIRPFGRGRRSGYRRLSWEDQQHLVAGYLPSRTTSQYLVIHAAPANLGLQIERDSDGAEVTVANQLGMAIQELFVVDRDEVFWCGALAAGETTRLKSIEQEKGIDRLRNWMQVHRPLTPFGFQTPATRRYYWNNSIDDAFGAPKMTTSRLVAKMNEARMLDCQVFDRVYYALTDKAPATVPVGVPGARQESGQHVIKGTW